MTGDTLQEIAAMAKEGESSGSLLDKRPKTDIGATLEKIQGEPVEVASFAFVTRNGRNDEGEQEEYTLVVITLSDGRIFHTGSKPIREYFAEVLPTDLPAMATFDKVRSTSNPSRSYWDIVG